jgi:acyl-CoA thioester hydrolase
MSTEIKGKLGATVRVPLRWADIDTLGHVNASRYHDFLEQARSKMFESREGGDAEGYVLARIELDHVGELTFDDGEVIVAFGVAEVGTSSARVEHEIRTREGRVVARGSSVVVAWDQARRVKRVIEDAERERLLALGGTPVEL